MIRMLCALACAACVGLPCAAAAQPFETVGTRAAGLGGAFVAVADDASAVYWNPAGLASGAFFSLVLDRTSLTVKPDDPWSGSSRSGAAIALGTPPLGLTYYRLRRTATSAPLATAAADPRPGHGDPRDIHVETLITHHAGATVVQSLADGVAVGATLKVVRGIAASGLFTGATRNALLEHDDLIGRGSNTVDADVGVMASLGMLRAGLTVRNLREPAFRTTDSGASLKLNRQARAGISFLPLQNWLMAIDLDLTREPDGMGDTRNLATGVEGRIHARATVRGGVRVNTTGEAGRRPALSLGGSVAVFGSTFLDAQVTGGSRDGDRGWGLSGRVLF
jgi:hypothetical protein